MDTIRVGILGLGTVGGQVVELLAEYGGELSIRNGTRLQPTVVAVRDPRRDRGLTLPLGLHLTDDASAVCTAPEVDVVVETVGGVDGPRAWIAAALAAGKDVVTANKAVLDAHGEELFALARTHGRRLLFEGAVAGAIPILQTLRAGFTAGPVNAVTAILNGSSNWLLGALGRGESLEAALAEANRRGLVERDPELDLSGRDAAHKLALLARLLEHCAVPTSTVRCEGIAEVGPDDLAFGRRRGLVIKPLAVLRRGRDSLALGVYPAWLEESHPLASVRDENNAVLLEGPTFESLLFQGKGAGGRPTAGSVVADLVRVSRGDGGPPVSAAVAPPLRLEDPLEAPRRYHVRFEVTDEPGVLATIARILAGHGISVACVEQPEPSAGRAVIHLITHRTTVRTVDAALGELAQAGPAWHRPPLRLVLEGDAGEGANR